MALCVCTVGGGGGVFIQFALKCDGFCGAPPRRYYVEKIRATCELFETQLFVPHAWGVNDTRGTLVSSVFPLPPTVLWRPAGRPTTTNTQLGLHSPVCHQTRHVHVCHLTHQGKNSHTGQVVVAVPFPHSTKELTKCCCSSAAVHSTGLPSTRKINSKESLSATLHAQWQ